MKAKKGQVKVITGNGAAAYAAMLCRPDVVTSYHITPLSEVAEQLSAFHEDGILDAEMVEGENSAMNVVAAASAYGGRAFTAASSRGLSFMYDAVRQASAFRAPVVMAIANRENPRHPGRCRLTREIPNSAPIRESTGIMRKFTNLKEDDIDKLQKVIDQRYAFIKTLCRNNVS
jgi:hypothetical protein